MDVKVFAVRVGSKYGSEYEDYIRSKIPSIEFLTNPKPDLFLQWNKLHFFNYTSEQPIVVIDIDIELIHDYEEMLNYPINRGDFLTIKPWWDEYNRCDINGGFYKFYPEDTKYIYEDFLYKQDYWREFYIKNGTKPGPVNGEENYVLRKVKERLNLKTLPDSWISPAISKENLKYMTRCYPGEYLYLGDFHPDVKLIHSCGNSKNG